MVDCLVELTADMMVVRTIAAMETLKVVLRVEPKDDHMVDCLVESTADMMV
jgi:hypothetical protein